ncbi:MAG: DUF2510 domain-containing protein [Microbacteriaceae bacterium]|nr:DUF2510 domain-containing protein [Microbacteriaceae bacterium]
MTDTTGGGALPAAGWYADPTDPTRARWWDGVQWTEEVSAAHWRPVAPAEPEAGPATPAAASALPSLDGVDFAALLGQAQSQAPVQNAPAQAAAPMSSAPEAAAPAAPVVAPPASMPQAAPIVGQPGPAPLPQPATAPQPGQWSAPFPAPGSPSEPDPQWAQPSPKAPAGKPALTGFARAAIGFAIAAIVIAGVLRFRARLDLAFLDDVPTIVWDGAFWVLVACWILAALFAIIALVRSAGNPAVRSPAITALVLSALGLGGYLLTSASGGGALQTAPMVRQVEQQILADDGVAVELSCPPTISPKLGSTVTCTADAGDGVPRTVDLVVATETPTTSELSYWTSWYTASMLEDEIESSFLDEGGFPIEVTCPAMQPVVAGESFECDAADEVGPLGAVIILIEDELGSYRIDIDEEFASNVDTGAPAA